LEIVLSACKTEVLPDELDSNVSLIFREGNRFLGWLGLVVLVTFVAFLTARKLSVHLLVFRLEPEGQS
jgi:Trk-type K+ transport system membrane component